MGSYNVRSTAIHPGTPLSWAHRSSHLRRYQTSGHDHFVTFSCHRRLPYLNHDTARITFLQVLETVRARHRFLSSATSSCPSTCISCYPSPNGNLSAKTLNVLKHETSQQRKGDRKQFSQTRYYDFNVFSRPRFVEKLRYLHRNPVKRGLVQQPEDWQWSSYRHWLTGQIGHVEVESHWTWTRRGQNAAIAA